MFQTEIDPVLQAAIEEHRMQIRKPAQEAGRTSTFFLFHTSKLDEEYRDTMDGPRIGFDAVTLARLLILFGMWGEADKALRWTGLAGESRLVPVGLFTDEQVFDEASQRIYTSRVRIEFDRGAEVPMRDPATGTQMQPGAQVSSYSIYRRSIEHWRSADRITIERSSACVPVMHEA